MLVLSRNPSEKIIIDTPSGRVTVMVVEVYNGHRVRIGVDCPREWPVHLEKLAAQIAAEEATK